MAAKWELLRGLFEGALERPKDARAAFLDAHTKNDPLLRQEIESLLAAHESAGQFLSAPALGPPVEPPDSPPEPHRSVSGQTRLAPGTSLGAFTILEPLGAGGMGEVYRARDTRLDRQVAIKVLSSERDTAPGSRERFEREARAISRLSHPRICTVHDIGVAEISESDVPYLVMELLDGETLAARIARGPLSIEQSLAYAIDIADALIAAHSQRIVHRDLKPANVMLTSTGVKLLDFGLAQLRMPEPAGLEVAPVSSVPGLTSAGLVMGTLPYTSPERLRGEKVDARTDIFAFGALLYEMLTGNRPFKADSQAGLIAAVLEHDAPPVSDRQPLTPASLDRIVQKCLAKNPDDRWQTARDLKSELVWVGEGRIEIEDASAPPDVVPAPTGTSARLPWLLMALAAVVATVLGIGWQFARAPTDALETRFEILTPPPTDPTAFALSEDGRQLAFVAVAEGGPRLWIRRLDQVTAQVLPRTEDANYPFWAPDGRAIGFFADGKLKRIDVAGGSPQVLADAPNGRGGAWSRDGVILFAPTNVNGTVLMQVPASGGAPEPVTHLRAGEANHRWPQFLPDGRRFLFLSQGARDEETGVYVASLDGGESTRVVAAETAAVFAPPRMLLVVRQGTLVAVPFDPARGGINGNPISVVPSVASARGLGRAAFAVSTSVLAYRADWSQRRQLMWVDRTGARRGTVGQPDENALADPELTVDGRQVAVSRTVQGKTDVWLIDVSTGALRRVTSDASRNQMPLWSPDGRDVVFESVRPGQSVGGGLFEKPATGAGDKTAVRDTGEDARPQAWSPDGRFLLYAILDPKTGADLWGLQVGGDRKPFPVVLTPVDEGAGQFSPDGQWIAYESNETGRLEIYVRPFPAPGGTWKVSTVGGSRPRWRRDGKELFYVASDGRLMAVPIALAADPKTLQRGPPVPLFQTRFASGAGISFATGMSKPQYAVAPDRRFLMNVPVDEATVPPITVALNWDAALKK
jgi:serine/threonine protein kinase/Tol biopolymer transport system component